MISKFLPAILAAATLMVAAAPAFADQDDWNHDRDSRGYEHHDRDRDRDHRGPYVTYNPGYYYTAPPPVVYAPPPPPPPIYMAPGINLSFHIR